MDYTSSSCIHRNLDGCGKDERRKLMGNRGSNWNLNEERFRRKHLVPQEKTGLGRKNFGDIQGLWISDLVVPEGTQKASERKVQVIKRNHLGQTGKLSADPSSALPLCLPREDPICSLN